MKHHVRREIRDRKEGRAFPNAPNDLLILLARVADYMRDDPSSAAFVARLLGIMRDDIQSHAAAPRKPLAEWTDFEIIDYARGLSEPK